MRNSNRITSINHWVKTQPDRWLKTGFMKTKSSNLRALTFLTGLLACWSNTLVLGGPPFLTDDPEPVHYQHWEFYIASQHTKTADGWTGTTPHFELNYGPVTNVMLHLIMPLAYNAPADGSSQYGYGNTELGVKYRFLPETSRLPEAGIFPLLEIPTGDESRGLGSRHLQAFLPLWLQKDFGKWTTYGGGGYGIHPGAGNKNWGFVGGVLQRQISDNFLLGAEVYHQTKMETGGRNDTAFNIGTVIDVTQHQHLLFSAGRSIDGPTDFQAYIAWQFTFGPEVFHSFSHWLDRR